MFRTAPSLAVFLESGLIYCIIILTLFGLFFTNSAAQIIVYLPVRIPRILLSELSNILRSVMFLVPRPILFRYPQHQQSGRHFRPHNRHWIQQWADFRQ